MCIRDRFCLNISPGRAYVKGYRVDKNRTTPVDVIKPRTTRSMDNISLPIDVGNIVRVNNISGSPSIGYGNTFSSVNLLDRRLGAGKLPHASAKVIGAARVYDWTPNTTGITTTFEARLFDIGWWVVLVYNVGGNILYIENILRIKEIVEKAGYNVTIGSPELNGYKILEGLTEDLILDEVSVGENNILEVNGKIPDLILLNNDLTAGIIPGLAGVVEPPVKMYDAKIKASKNVK